MTFGPLAPSLRPGAPDRMLSRGMGRGRASERTRGAAAATPLSTTAMPRNTDQPVRPADPESSEVARQPLLEVRSALLHLQTTLHFHERTAYEQRYGQV